MQSMTNMVAPATEVVRTQPRRKIGVLAGAVFRLSRLLRARMSRGSSEHVAATSTEDRYRMWRQQELRQQLTDHFDVTRVRGRDVLDFGCGTGELSRMLCEYGGRSVTGVDMSAEAIDKANRDATCERGTASSATFVHAHDNKRIPVEDDSSDLICTFDVLEHVPDIDAACCEWRRVLRRDGRVWIWWSPWRGPFGHHLSSLIPIPWVHLLLPQKTIFSACAAMYDDPAFVPRKWDIDPDTGQKKPNKWHDVESFEPFLNRLTRRSFERVVSRSGLKVLRRETHGFRGRISGWLSAVLRKIPVIGDCFVSYYIYEVGRASQGG